MFDILPTTAMEDLQLFAIYRSAMGMAAIGVALWKYVVRYSPENPNFFNRDRFVLSNGKYLSTC